MAEGGIRPITEELRRIGRLLGSRGLSVADDGNLSARAPDGTVWITARGVRKDALEPDDLVRIDLEGKKLEGSGSVLLGPEERADASARQRVSAATSGALAARRLTQNTVDRISAQLSRKSHSPRAAEAS